jgi:hypothetical protein
MDGYILLLENNEGNHPLPDNQFTLLVSGPVIFVPGSVLTLKAEKYIKSYLKEKPITKSCNYVLLLT